MLKQVTEWLLRMEGAGGVMGPEFREYKSEDANKL